MKIYCPESNVVMCFADGVGSFGSKSNQFNNNYNPSSQQPADIAELMEAGTATTRKFKFNHVLKDVECVAMFKRVVGAPDKYYLIGLVLKYADVSKHFMPMRPVGYQQVYSDVVTSNIDSGLLTLEPVMISAPEVAPSSLNMFAGVTKGQSALNYFPYKYTMPLQQMASYHLKAGSVISNGVDGLLDLINTDFGWPVAPDRFSGRYTWFDLDAYTEDLLVIMAPAYSKDAIPYTITGETKTLNDLYLKGYLSYAMNDIAIIKAIYANHDVIGTLECRHFGYGGV